MLTVAVVLAAGRGSRMRSDRAKVLHCIDEHTMLWHVLTQAHEANVEHIIVVVGHQADSVMDEARRWGRSHGREVQFSSQPQQLGTGHAVQQAQQLLELLDAERVLVLSGDVPLLRSATLRRLLETYDEPPDDNLRCAMLTFEAANPRGMGRIVRNTKTGAVERIVEEKDCANDAERNISEVNAGVYAFRWSALREALPHLKSNNAQNEFYLTDVVRMMTSDASGVEAVLLESETSTEAMGVNTRQQLDEARSTLQSRPKQI